MTFLDEQCLVFDTEEENKLEYTGIHNVRLTIKGVIMVIDGRHSRNWLIVYSRS